MMQRNNSVSLFLLMLLPACQPSKENTRAETSSAADTTWAMIPFKKADDVNPVLTAGPGEFLCPMRNTVVKWEEKDVFNPAAVVRDGKIHLLYRAEDRIGKYAGTSRLGLATSEDGLHFTRMAAPVFYPDKDSLTIYEWEGGTEDPRLVESEDGRYVMTYTAYDGRIARLLLATSRDLMQWSKHGTVLRGKYKDTWSKSGAIVVRRDGHRMVAQKINGKYWMYFGDTDLFIAASDDLIHWTPVEEDGKLKSVLKPRPGYFDSRLVESGPFALLQEKGIVLMYNGMNLDSLGDPAYAAGAYCAGQALFDKHDPSRVIDRLEKPFIQPDRDYEISGQVNQVCFLEGLVYFRNKWFLYYGTADSKIAVAVRD